MLQLRDYQRECIDEIEKRDAGSYLVQMATGLGKTATFTRIPRRGRVLVLAHREELVTQPIKYYDCPVGIEMASKSSDGEEVVIASVQSLIHRLDKFNPHEFDMIVTDEAHHAAAQSYKKIYAHFNPRLHLGFTATPNRGDNVRLDDVFEDIIFERDIKWAIQNNYLCDIYCMRVNIGYDLTKVAKRMGDFAIGELETAMNTDVLNKAIAEAYYKHAKGQTLIFATSVEHAQDIAKEIPGAVAVTADTKNRNDIIQKFTNKEIPVLVNCMIFTEGTDMPLIETIMIARPTQNASLYAQMVGRGLRLYQGKEKLNLIDLVGATGKNNICTAPTLIGIDLKVVPKHKQDEIEGDLFDLPELVIRKSDCPEGWIRNIEIVDLWAQEQGYTTHNINMFKMPDGSFIVQLPRKRLIIPAQNELGETIFNGRKMKIQKAIDELYQTLQSDYVDYEYIWNLKIAQKWGKQPASDNQMRQIRRFKGLDFGSIDTGNLTKLQASQILNRVFARRAA